MATIRETREYMRSLEGPMRLREADWRELSRWICPYRGIFRGEEGAPDMDAGRLLRFTHAAGHALTRGASGITSGMTPRNISWFRPDFSDGGMGEAPGARAWLDGVDAEMKQCLANGGFYQAIQTFNIDLLWSGCALLYCEKGETAPLRFECCQVGTFMVGLDNEGQLETVARSLSITPRGMERMFGLEAMSRRARTALERTPYEPLRVWHLTRPRLERKAGALDSLGMPWESLYFEDGEAEKFLRVSGYHEMPFFFTVWHEGRGPYGTGPGDEALPDARQIDTLERRKLEGLGKLVDPPTRAHSSLKGVVDLAPGGLNFTPEPQAITPILDLSPYAHSLGYLREEIATVTQRLEQSLMASIFASMPLDQQPPNMSATEFLERKREAMQQLGPVISAYEPNVLTPMLYRVAQTLDREGLLPPAPQSLQGMPLLMKMEFISPMTNALRQNGADTVRSLLGDVAMILQSTRDAEILDKVDMDQVIDELASGLGVPGPVVRADADVAAIREQRRREMASQEAMRDEAMRAQAREAGARASLAENQAMQAIEGGME